MIKFEEHRDSDIFPGPFCSFSNQQAQSFLSHPSNYSPYFCPDTRWVSQILAEKMFPIGTVVGSHCLALGGVKLVGSGAVPLQFSFTPGAS